MNAKERKEKAALVDALTTAQECLESILEDTDGPDGVYGERTPNPLLVKIRAALALAKAGAQ